MRQFQQPSRPTCAGFAQMPEGRMKPGRMRAHVFRTFPYGTTEIVCINVQVCHWGVELAKRPIKKPTEQIWRLTANKKNISNHICCCPRSMLIAMVTVTMTKNTKCQARCTLRQNDNTTN